MDNKIINNMTRNARKAIMVIIAAFLIAFPGLPASAGQGNWHIFRGDARLTGITRETIPANPSLLWTFQAGTDIKSSPVISNSLIIIGSGNGTVYAIDMDGKLKWSFDTGNTIEAPALIHKNRVYIGNLSGRLYCLDLLSGNKVWEYECDNQIMGSPNIWNDGRRELILVGSYDYYLHAVDAGDGSPVWKYELYNYLNATVAIDNGLAIFGGCDGYLHRVDLKTGQGLPEIEIASYVAGSPALENGIAYVGDYDGVFSAVDFRDGKILWTWSDEERKLPFIASPSVHGNSVIIGNRDRFIYSLDKKTGSMNWKTNSGSRVDSSTLTDGQIIIAANMRGDIMLLDFRTGRVLWNWESGSPVSGSPAVAGGRIIIGTGEGTILCFGE
jgi:eukaryotic-like serine/threonine-protein kinase